MTQAIRIASTGGPERLTLEDVQLGSPQAGEVHVRHAAIGVNYIDIYHRTGAYPLPLPSGLGVEGAGTIIAVGEGVTPGAYAMERLIPAARVLKLPDNIAFDVAASLTFKALTVEYLIRRCVDVKAGDRVLFHAAAGGVGSIACQWLRDIGAIVVGTVSSDAKAAYAREHGCTHTINYKQEDIAKRVREWTNGEGVSVAWNVGELRDCLGTDAAVGCRRTGRQGLAVRDAGIDRP